MRWTRQSGDSPAWRSAAGASRPGASASGDVAGALAELCVLDCSRVLAGPWAGQILADLGADVIKVERPGTGDDTRHWGPPYLRDQTGKETSEAGYFLCANRGKRSLTVDFATADGRDIVRRLAAHSDVFLDDHKVRDLARHGLDYESP